MISGQKCFHNLRYLMINATHFPFFMSGAIPCIQATSSTSISFIRSLFFFLLLHERIKLIPSLISRPFSFVPPLGHRQAGMK